MLLIGLVSHFLFVAFALTSQPQGDHHDDQEAKQQLFFTPGSSFSSYSDLEPTFTTFKGKGHSTSPPKFIKEKKKAVRPSYLSLGTDKPSTVTSWVRSSRTRADGMQPKSPSDEAESNKEEEPLKSSLTFTHEVVPSVDSFLKPTNPINVEKAEDTKPVQSSYLRRPKYVIPPNVNQATGEQQNAFGGFDVKDIAAKTEQALKETQSFNTLPKAKKLSRRLSKKESIRKKMTISTPLNFSGLGDRLP